MSFFYGFTDELVKLADEDKIKYHGFTIPKSVVKGIAEGHGKGVGKGAIEGAAEKASKYKKEIAGAGVGALAGKALGKIPGARRIPIRGAGGALLGLLASQSGRIAEHLKGKAKK